MNKLNKLITMTDQQIQDWLRKVSVEIDADVLSIALSGADNDIRNCIFRNMSTHAKAQVKESIQEQSKNNINESEIRKCINILENLI